MTNTQTTYVLDDVEVRLTGRKAERQMPGPSGPRTTSIFEITPVDQDTHGDWKKWVPMSTLFEVIQ